MPPKPIQKPFHTKVALFLLGAGATGKTTTRKLLTSSVKYEEVEFETIKGSYVRKRNPLKGSIVQEDIDICIYPTIKTGLVGSYASGTDSICAPELIMRSFAYLLDHCEIVLVDGVMSSPRWVDMVNQAHLDFPQKNGQPGITPLLVHFDFTLDQICERLKYRRSNRGKVEDRLPPNTIENARQFIGKTNRCIKYFKRDCQAEIEWLTIPYGLTPFIVVNRILGRLSSLVPHSIPLPVPPKGLKHVRPK